MRLPVGLAACCLMVCAQVPEYSFYPEFRKWWFGLPAAERTPLSAVIDRYTRRLADEQVTAAEIARRAELIRARRPDLERDFWNRFFLAESPEFNTAPNAFLAAMVEGRKPGRALEVGMGEGRNALFLAKLGWDVTGFDPADQAVELARKRAKQFGLKIQTQAVNDAAFDFGTEQWDLIVFSWVPPSDAERVVRSLRPGGVVVFEGPRFWFEQNGAMQHFAKLRVLRYEDEIVKGDYFQQESMPVVRLLAERPTR